MGECSNCDQATQELCKSLGTYKDGHEDKCSDKEQPQTEIPQLPYYERGPKCPDCKHLRECRAVNADFKSVEGVNAPDDLLCEMATDFVRFRDLMVKPYIDELGFEDGVKLALGALFYNTNETMHRLRIMSERQSPARQLADLLAGKGRGGVQVLSLSDLVGPDGSKLT